MENSYTKWKEMQEKIQEESNRHEKIAQARKFLQEQGYFTYNLWTKWDVQDRYPKVTDEQAQEVLKMCLTNEWIMEQVYVSISDYVEDTWGYDDVTTADDYWDYNDSSEDWTIHECKVVKVNEDLHSREDGYLFFPSKEKASEYLKSITKS